MPPARRARRPEAPLEARSGEVLVWTDGACSGNPGPGGWAAIVVPADGAEPVELSGGEAHTTNNRMEYTAALEGLRSLPAGSRACIVTDSRLMLDSMTKWIAGWKRKGWKTAGGEPVKNQDLVHGARRRDRPPRRRALALGARATRSAPRTRTRRSTTARTGSRWRPPAPPPDQRRVSVWSRTSSSCSVASRNVARAAARKSRAPARPGSASRNFPPGASSSGTSVCATATFACV